MPIDTERLLKIFVDLVKIDSPSGEESAVCEALCAFFDTFHWNYTVDAGGNLCLRIPAQHTDSKTKLLLTAHMDVVPPCIGVTPVIKGSGDKRVIYSNGDTVLGADDKAALACLMEALRLSVDANLPRPELILLITTREETSLGGAKEIDPAFYSDADFGIAFDHTGEQGTVIHEAASYYYWKMTVHGKSVHAGIMPEKGINAIQLLSTALNKLHWGRLDESTTSNIGFIKGGKATNIVPDLAVAEGEIRGHNDQQLLNELEVFKDTLSEVVSAIEGASFEFEVQQDFAHYLTPLDHPMVVKVADVMREMGLPVKFIRSNGGSDINVFAQYGVSGIVLSAGYVAPHTLHEHVPLQDMMTVTELILKLWETL